MTNIEEKLFNVMTIRKWIITTFITAILFGVGGWWGGRQYMVHQIKENFGQAVTDISQNPLLQALSQPDKTDGTK